MSLSRYRLADFATYFAPSTDCILVAIPSSVLGVLRSMAYASLDDIRVYDTINPDGTVYLSDVSRETYHDEIGEFLAMSNCQLSLQELIGAISNVATSIQANSCCSSSGFQGGPGGEVWYGTEEPTSTIQSSESERCRMANILFDGWVANLRLASGFSLASLVAGGILVVVVSTLIGVPPVGLFIAIGALGFAFGGFTAMADYMDANREEIVCAIYSSQSYVDFMLWLEGFVTEVVSSLEIEIYGIDIALLSLYRAYWDTNTWNRLQNGVAGLESVNPTDCDECDDTCPVYTVFADEEADVTGGPTDYTFTGDSIQSGVWHYVDLRFGVKDGAICGDAVNITNTSTTGVTPSSPPSYRAWSYVPGVGEAGNLYNSNTSPGGTDINGVYVYAIKSAAPFSATINFSIP